VGYTSFLFTILLLVASANTSCEQANQQYTKTKDFLAVIKTVDGDTFWSMIAIKHQG
jgi:hypothetical protein